MSWFHFIHFFFFFIGQIWRRWASAAEIVFLLDNCFDGLKRCCDNNKNKLIRRSFINQPGNALILPNMTGILIKNSEIQTVLEIIIMSLRIGLSKFMHALKQPIIIENGQVIRNKIESFCCCRCWFYERKQQYYQRTHSFSRNASSKHSVDVICLIVLLYIRSIKCKWFPMFNR